MKASELIKKLQAAIAEHGDVVVACYESCGDSYGCVGVTEASYATYDPNILYDYQGGKRVDIPCILLS